MCIQQTYILHIGLAHSFGSISTVMCNDEVYRMLTLLVEGCTRLCWRWVKREQSCTIVRSILPCLSYPSQVRTIQRCSTLRSFSAQLVPYTFTFNFEIFLSPYSSSIHHMTCGPHTYLCAVIQFVVCLSARSCWSSLGLAGTYQFYGEALVSHRLCQSLLTVRLANSSVDLCTPSCVHLTKLFCARETLVCAIWHLLVVCRDRRRARERDGRR